MFLTWLSRKVILVGLASVSSHDQGNFMSIQNKIRVIRRVDNIATELKQKYPSQSQAYPELTRLNESLLKLIDYLSHLDELAPNYTTNEIDKHMLAITTNMDILKEELEKEDYLKLLKGVRLIKLVLKFHPTKYSRIEFIVIWLYEMIYFI